jgi:hypothetical protein
MLISVTVFSKANNGSGDPSSPCSSPVKVKNKIERLGPCPSFLLWQMLRQFLIKQLFRSIVIGTTHCKRRHFLHLRDHRNVQKSTSSGFFSEPSQPNISELLVVAFSSILKKRLALLIKGFTIFGKEMPF